MTNQYMLLDPYCFFLSRAKPWKFFYERDFLQFLLTIGLSGANFISFWHL